MDQIALALRSAPRGGGWLGVTARVLVVIGAHLAILFALAQLHPQLREQVEPLFVSLITPPQPKTEEPAPAPPPAPVPRKTKAEVRPLPRQQPQAFAPAEPRESPIEVPPAPVPEAALSAPAAETAPEPASAGAGAGTSAAGSGAGKGNAPIVAPRFDVAYLNNPRPEYPRIARRMGEQGRVLLHVFVNASGSAEKVEIRTSSGSPRLDQAAREAVQRWKFVPARRGDEAVSAWVLVPISFVLES